MAVVDKVNIRLLDNKEVVEAGMHLVLLVALVVVSIMDQEVGMMGQEVGMVGGGIRLECET